MNAVKKLIAALDRLQQSRPWLAFPIAVWKKFGDDQAGNLAALIAYYGFASLFPLLLAVGRLSPILIVIVCLRGKRPASLAAHSVAARSRRGGEREREFAGRRAA